MTGRERIHDYADDVASPSPAPGGGSVAAVCGALAAALARMVANIAIGKNEYKAAHKELRRVCNQSEDLQDTLLLLAEEDSKAYRAVVKSFSMPKDTPAQKERRRQAVQAALKKASEIPLKTMEGCLAVLKFSRIALEKGSREAFTDAGSAALIAHAALRSAELNVKVNLISIKDVAFCRMMNARAKKMSRDADDIIGKVERTVLNRLQ